LYFLKTAVLLVLSAVLVIIFYFVGERKHELDGNDTTKNIKRDITEGNREEEREFQLHILRTQLNYENKITYFNTVLAVSISLFILGTTLLFIHSTEIFLQSIANLWVVVGAIFFAASTVMLIIIQSRIENALDKIRQKFNINKKDC
jgi:Ca2+/Na+ antiporter